MLSHDSIHYFRNGSFQLEEQNLRGGVSAVCEAGNTSESQDVSNNLPPHSHAYYMAPPRFWYGSDTPNPPPSSNPTPQLTGSHPCRLPLPRASKGVAPRTFILCCVRVGHVNIRNQIWAHVNDKQIKNYKSHE